MRRPSQPRGTRAQTVFFPPPTGGWNARDAITNMAPSDAITLDNFVPDAGGVRIRGGHSVHATTSSQPVESLMEYNAPSLRKLFAGVESEIYDVSASGTASPVLTHLFNGRWQHTMFSNAGGDRLFCANGEDTIKCFDGSTWTAPVITGVASNTIISIVSHMSRLWLVENASSKIWYLPLNAITGAATSIDLGALTTYGGYLMAMASWSKDGGRGLEDLAVFLMSTGETLIYQGADPSSASTWSLVGIFKLPPPVGRRCFVKIGGDLGVITSQGVVSLSTVLPEPMASVGRLAATDKIVKAVRDAYFGSSQSFGWQIVESARDQLMILNVPLAERQTQHQYVMNTQTGAWARWTGMNGGVWGTLGDRLFFGGNDGTVYEVGHVTTDLGEPVEGLIISAFSDLGTRNIKRFTMARVLFYGEETYTPLLAVRVDYDESDIQYTPPTSAASGAFWDEAEWDVAAWAAGARGNAIWQPIAGMGAVVSAVMAVSIGDQFTFNGADILFETGQQI